MNRIQGWLTLFSASAVLAACGGSNGGANFTIGNGNPPTPDPGIVSFGISDAPIDDVKEVVIAIDKIRLVKPGDDIEVDVFTSEALGLVDADSFQIDLLQYQGSQQAIFIEGLELAVGDYDNIVLTILDEDINSSYVTELDDVRKPIKVPSDNLRLGGFTVVEVEEQTFTIEFNLRQSMTYKPGSDEYNLKPRGVRIQDNSNDATLSGDVDSSLFDTEFPCDEKADPLAGNIVYLYEGHGLAAEDLADVFDEDESEENVPAGAIAPFAAVAVDGEGEYRFAFLPAGAYTLAFSCNAAEDDPDNVDGLSPPLPDDQLIELTLTAGAGTVCSLPIDGDSCAN